MANKYPDEIVNQRQIEIYKAHQAIAVMPTAGSRITLLMRRFFNVLLQQAQEIGPAETYRVPFDHILSGAKYSSANFEVAKNTLRSMAKTTVEWSVVRDDGGDDGVERRWGVSALLADAEIIEQNRRLYLEWSYSPKIRHRLLDPNRYVQLSLHIYSTLKSGTAAALYEVCMRYLTNYGGLTNKETWEWWRPRLTGIPDGDDEQVREYKYFKRDTLLPAIKEINAITDIEVELLEFKTGRKITHIQFSTRKKAQSSLDVDSAQSLVDDGLMKRILAFGIPEAMAAKLYSSREEETVRATVEYVEARLRKGGVDSPAALFRDALKKGYGKLEGERTRTKLRSADTARPIEKEPQQEDPEGSRLRRAALAYIESLTPEKKASLEEEFAKTLDGMILGYYKKHGLKSKIVQSELIKHVIRTNPSLS